VIAIFWAQFDGEFQIFHGGFGFAGEAIESGHGVDDVIGFGSKFAGAIEMLASIIPAAEVHEGHAVLVAFIGGAGIIVGGAADALFANAEVHTGAVAQFLAGAADDFLQYLLCPYELLLLEEEQGLFILFKLLLDAGIDHIDGRDAGGHGLLNHLCFQQLGAARGDGGGACGAAFGGFLCACHNRMLTEPLSGVNRGKFVDLRIYMGIFGQF